MRLSTQQFFQQGTTAITDLNSQLARVQQQISSGRSILTAADDPTGATQALRLESQLRISEQFGRNLNLAEIGLQTTEQSLSAIETSVDRVRELVIQAANGTLGNEERNSIAVELNQRVAEIQDLVNTRDEQGEYIFAGYNSSELAYVRDAEGNFEFQGNNGERRLQVSEASFLSVTESANNIFESIDITNGQVITEAATVNAGSLQIQSSSITDQAEFNQSFPEDYVVTFNDEADVVPNGANFSVARASDGEVIVANEVYIEADGINVGGIRLDAIGAPVAGDEFTTSRVVAQDNILNAIESIAEGIATFGDAEQRVGFTDGAIVTLDAIQGELREARARVGVSLSRVDSTRNNLADRELSQQAILSEVRDLDFAAAISNLSFISFALEASQASFSRISGLSLFNFIR